MNVVQLKPRPKRPGERAAAAVAANSAEAAADRATVARRPLGTVLNVERAFTGERRLDRQANHEPSLAMSFVVLFVVLAAMVAIVANISVPDIQLSSAELWDGPT
jgi:hypothetical protein